MDRQRLNGGPGALGPLFRAGASVATDGEAIALAISLRRADAAIGSGEDDCS